MSTKLSAFAAKRVGTLNRFYTRSEIGELLARELGPIEPHSVVDLGAGEGSLSLAVVRKWPNLDVTTVDIDQACVDALHGRLLDAGVRSHTHRELNVLDHELPAHLDKPEFDVAVCNPPFYRPEWDRAFARILQAADFAEACPNVTDATAEILFFAQILRVVREGGTIALIVPAGLATGRNAVAFRRALVEKHTLKSVIQLPPYSFADTEAYCFILIITKGRLAEPQPIKLLRLDDQSAVSDPVWIDLDAAENRLDWSYHSAHARGQGATFTLRELGTQVHRGSINSVERRSANYPVFHTGDFPAPGETVALAENSTFPISKLVVAEAGDILIARVDRDLHEKITLVMAGRAAITDCLFRVRVPEDQRLLAFRALSSAEGRDRIRSVTKGVGARLLGKGELLDLPLVPRS